MAVALAADSKVTVGGSGQQKTYDTVNKLFTLSRVHPVGVMIYGNAEFMEFPWETIIKSYRRQKNSDSHATLFEWSEDFIKFLYNFHKFKQGDIARNISSILGSWIQKILDDVRIELISSGDYGQDRLAEVLESKLDAYTNVVKANKNFGNQRYSMALRKIYSSCVDDQLVPFQTYSKSVREKIERFLYFSLSKFLFSPIHSGIVFAGFGEQEKFPALRAYQLDGLVGPSLKYNIYEEYDVTRRSQGIIVPFAQQEMVYRFMEGIDPAYEQFLSSSIRELITRNASSVLDAFIDPAIDATHANKVVIAAAEKSFQEFATAAREWRQARFPRPIIDMVMSLPKEELANLAESLVNLTSLKRRVSRDSETVGGPVDVAVISKGDGFIWIKRKHYFREEMNIHFKANYFRDVDAVSEAKKEERNVAARRTRKRGAATVAKA